jgi:hypothetical protein
MGNSCCLAALVFNCPAQTRLPFVIAGKQTYILSPTPFESLLGIAGSLQFSHADVPHKHEDSECHSHDWSPHFAQNLSVGEIFSGLRASTLNKSYSILLNLISFVHTLASSQNHSDQRVHAIHDAASQMTSKTSDLPRSLAAARRNLTGVWNFMYQSPTSGASPLAFYLFLYIRPAARQLSLVAIKTGGERKDGNQPIHKPRLKLPRLTGVRPAFEMNG